MVRLLLLLLLVGACAQVPMAPNTEDAAGKTFSPPSPGMGALYLYRADTIGGFRTIELTAGQRILGDLASHTWMRVEFPPGAHNIRCRFESPAVRTVNLAAGEIRYIEVGISVGRCLLNEVDATEARPQILSGSRAAEIR